MNSRSVLLAVVVLIFIAGVFWFFLQMRPQSPAEQEAQTQEAKIARGKYLVTIGGCNDCHSPKIFTPTGPMLDTTRLLSGHPAGTRLPEFPLDYIGPTKWGAVTTNDLTAWFGPWGVSYAYNLTPDPGTGLGSYTEEIFIKTLRTGKKLGVGRDILPPMPWQTIGQMSDDDLKAVYAYLRSLPAVNNLIPNPIPPPEVAASMKKP
jgi:mono/diheme cytochrome c family protein